MTIPALIVLAWLGISLFLPPAAADVPPATRAQPLAATLKSLTAEIERIVAHTKPADWEDAHACLYYAFAAQYLLAKRGIWSALRVGAVIYDPGTPTQYGIRPHFWLETSTHFIDPATQPRWNEITVIPLDLVVDNTAHMIPGRTLVLVQRGAVDPGLLQFLEDHRRHFERTVDGAK